MCMSMTSGYGVVATSSANKSEEKCARRAAAPERASSLLRQAALAVGLAPDAGLRAAAPHAAGATGRPRVVGVGRRQAD